MKSNKLASNSKINTHSLKASNFMFLVPEYDDQYDTNPEVLHIPLDVMLSESPDHHGMHYLVYVLDSEEVKNKVTVNQEELDSVVAQIKIELCCMVKMIGVVNE